MDIFVDPKIFPKPILTFYFILLFYYYYFILFLLYFFLLFFFFFLFLSCFSPFFSPTHVQLQNLSPSYFSLFLLFSLLLSFSFLFFFLSFSLFSLPTLSPKPISSHHLPSSSFPCLIYSPFIFLLVSHFSLSPWRSITMAAPYSTLSPLDSCHQRAIICLWSIFSLCFSLFFIFFFLLSHPFSFIYYYYYYYYPILSSYPFFPYCIQEMGKMPFFIFLFL